MHTRATITEYCEANEIEVLLLPEEYDSAIVGLGCKFNEYSVSYDTKKCIQVLQDFHGMEYLDAVEYFEFNVSGGYLGTSTPTFMVDITECA